jgi:hypothetical protein
MRPSENCLAYLTLGHPASFIDEENVESARDCSLKNRFAKESSEMYIGVSFCLVCTANLPRIFIP